MSPLQTIVNAIDLRIEVASYRAVEVAEVVVEDSLNGPPHKLALCAHPAGTHHEEPKMAIRTPTSQLL